MINEFINIVLYMKTWNGGIEKKKKDFAQRRPYEEEDKETTYYQLYRDQ